MASTMRPGVYSKFTLTPMMAKHKGRAIGIVAESTIEQKQIVEVTSLSQAKQLFGEISETNRMMQLITAVYANGSPLIYASTTNHDILAWEKIKALNMIDDGRPYLIIMDKNDKKKLDFIIEVMAVRNSEVLVIVPWNQAEFGTPDQEASYLNNNRICLTYPPVSMGQYEMDFSAALLASIISQSENIASNLNGESVNSGFYIKKSVDLAKLELFLSKGICIFEQTAGYVELIRGMTTSTHDADGKDNFTHRNISVTLIMDTVIPGLRKLLTEKLKGSINSSATLESVLSLVACRLGEYQDDGIISSYEMPKVHLDEADPTVCIVEVAFTIAQGISQVYLTAHISI